MKNLDEVIHIFDSHTAHGLFIIDGEEEEYSRDELIEIIEEAREEISSFLENCLLPVIAELKKRRSEDIYNLEC